MPAAVHLRLDADPRLTPHVERPDAFGPVHLMRGHGEQVDLECIEIDGDLPGSLHGVAMKEDAHCPA